MEGDPEERRLELKEDGYAKMKRRTENRGFMEKVDAKMDLSKDRALEEEL